MKRTTGRTALLVGGLMFFVVSARTAAGQWHATAIGVAEYDTKQTLLLLAGVSATPGGKGIAPLIGVQGYTLGFDNGPGRTNVFTMRPYAGLANHYDGGSVAGTIGYAFANKDVAALTSVTGNDGDGVVVTGAWDQWGRGEEPMGYQVLGAYNFGSSSLWTRGRATRRITPAGRSQRRFGGEVAYLNGRGYSAVQPGAILEFHDPKGKILGLGAGMKFFGSGGGNAFYFKVEGVLPLMR